MSASRDALGRKVAGAVAQLLDRITARIIHTHPLDLKVHGPLRPALDRLEHAVHQLDLALVDTLLPADPEGRSSAWRSWDLVATEQPGTKRNPRARGRYHCLTRDGDCEPMKLERCQERRLPPFLTRANCEVSRPANAGLCSTVPLSPPAARKDRKGARWRAERAAAPLALPRFDTCSAGCAALNQAFKEPEWHGDRPRAHCLIQTGFCEPSGRHVCSRTGGHPYLSRDNCEGSNLATSGACPANLDASRSHRAFLRTLPAIADSSQSRARARAAKARRRKFQRHARGVLRRGWEEGDLDPEEQHSGWVGFYLDP